jgi:hypothetical protein
MINSISVNTLWHYEEDGVSYFHPRPCLIPNDEGGSLFMTLQPVTGSDVFHHVKWAISHDHGATWAAPADIPELGWKPYKHETFEGVCDVVPDYHAQTNTILAMGHNVYYQNDRLLDTYGTWNKDNVGFRERFQRYPVYSIRRADGSWLTRQKFHVPGFEECKGYTPGCSQRVTLADGRLLIPLSFATWGQDAHHVCTVLCSYDGAELVVQERGSASQLDVGRGLLEPSVILHEDRFYMTMRAEDGHGHVAVSDGGLDWAPIKSWQWEDGKPLGMSTTQQHWLVHRGALYLVYTREAADNPKTFRWRAPLFIARVDPERLCLIRDTEQVVFPMLGDGVEDGRVPLMGNFHTVNISAELSAVTVGENRPHDGYAGNTLIAFIE